MAEVIAVALHIAGPMVDWVQKCTRCGGVLNDYRDASWPDDQSPPKGFEVDARVESLSETSRVLFVVPADSLGGPDVLPFCRE